MMLHDLQKENTAREAGRLMMAQQLARILETETAVRQSADPVAVHEMRKAIRRTFTSYRLFEPYFSPGVLAYHRRRLRRLMRRLGRSRDLTIFRQGLEAYNTAAERPLLRLSATWWAQQEQADQALRDYLAKPKRQAFLARYQAFCETPGAGAPLSPDAGAQPRITYIAPALIYERLAAVRTTGDNLAALSVPELHSLRIQFKELRYTLDFLAPILGPETAELLSSLNLVQDHLGAVNDARVALTLLEEVPDLDDEVAAYCAYQQQELARLVSTLTAVWDKIDNPIWRGQLAAALADV